VIQPQLVSESNSWKCLSSEMYEITERQITVIVDAFIPKSFNFQDPNIIRQQDVMKN